MNLDLLRGTQGHQTKIVEKKDTAPHFESGSAMVFATPSLIALMEKTAFKSIDTILPAGYSSVGIQINIQHVKASLPGAIITCKSEVTNVEGKKVFFKISAYDEKGDIGIAEHIRFIINLEEFMTRLNK